MLRPTSNRFDRMEWAGAFGDLGTLIPFLVAYVSVLKVDPFGILFSFGLALLLCGLVCKTPFPVQPMKAIGAAAATQAAQTAVITPATLFGADLTTGVIWLGLGLSGAATRIAKLVPRTVVVGIVLGLGVSFIIEGVTMMSTGWAVAVVGLLGTVWLRSNRIVPAMFVLLLYGAACGIWLDPSNLQLIAQLRPAIHFPHLVLGSIGWHDLAIGTFALALPQVPLTLGNALIAICEENNRLFPTRPVNERQVAISTGAMNIFGAMVGGVPMCHGAGGMAGHVAFGARTGGAPIILGLILLALAFGFSDSVQALFGVFPRSILGVILTFAGAQLVLGATRVGKGHTGRLIVLATAALSIWNVGLAFVLGLVLTGIAKRLTVGQDS